MKQLFRLSILTLGIGFLTAPEAVAGDGPFQRLRARIHDRLFGPDCPGGVCPAPQVPAPAPASPAPPVVGQAAPQVMQGIGDGEWIQRILIRRQRERAIDEAVKNGVPIPGGGVRTVTRAEAEKLASRVTDDEVIRYAKAKGAKGALGDGTFLKWLWEHREEILKFILSIMALFGDDEPVAIGIVPIESPGGWRLLVVAVSSARIVCGVM